MSHLQYYALKEYVKSHTPKACLLQAIAIEELCATLEKFCGRELWLAVTGSESRPDLSVTARPYQTLSSEYVEDEVRITLKGVTKLLGDWVADCTIPKKEVSNTEERNLESIVLLIKKMGDEIRDDSFYIVIYYPGTFQLKKSFWYKEGQQVFVAKM